MTAEAPGGLVGMLTGWQARLAIYGRLGIVVYAVVAAITTGGAWALIEVGLGDRIPWLSEHPAGAWATLVFAWWVAKIPRIGLTLVLTPIVARRTGRAPVAPVESPPSGEPAS
jgi:hypothetical protein